MNFKPNILQMGEEESVKRLIFLFVIVGKMGTCLRDFNHIPTRRKLMACNRGEYLI